MPKSTAPLALGSLFFCATAYCQGRNFLGYDTSRMRVTISLDREVYLPSEVMKVTLTVSNLAAVPVVSLSPFDLGSACLRLYRKEGGGADFCSGGDPGPIAVNDAGLPLHPPVLPTTTFGAGETKQIVMDSNGGALQIGIMLASGGAPSQTGTYTLEYQYGTSSARAGFTVAPTRLEAYAVVRIRDIMYTDHPPEIPPRPLPMYAHVVAVRSGDVTYICVQQGAVWQRVVLATAADIRRGAGLEDPKVNLPFASPLMRVAESAAPVLSISAVADERENLAITWRDSDGGERRASYAAGYPILDGVEREQQRVQKYWQEHPKR